jgi:hypothetical protein
VISYVQCRQCARRAHVFGIPWMDEHQGSRHPEPG